MARRFSLGVLFGGIVSAADVQIDFPQGPKPLPPVPPSPGALRPHVVLFVIDDWGWANLGVHRDQAAPADATRTPNFDTAVHDGVLLERHYTFRWCAPTRSAFMSGRMPYHVLEQTNYVSGGMNMIPAKLKQVGYATHQVGKWHLGALTEWMTPVGRGFDTSFGYLSGGEDHYTHMIGGAEFGCVGTDLWKSNAPAYTGNGTYGAFLYNDEVQRVINAHNVSQPLFLYVATQDAHAPDQVPLKYSGHFAEYTEGYAVYNGMVSAADELFGNMTATLQAREMYSNTLIIVSSDNGGPASKYTSGNAASNWPLRGGKKTDFEGGIRVNAFLSGGFLPQAIRGTMLDGYIHCADWYPTICGLAGGSDCRDAVSAAARGVPAVDGFDVWPYLSNATAESPRTEIMVARCEIPNQHNIPRSVTSPNCSGAYIRGNFKLVLGEQFYGFWQGPVFPNVSTNHSLFDFHVDCGTGCLFNIREDPAETVNLARSNPTLLNDLRSRFFALNATQFDAPHLPLDPALCKSFASNHGGYVGPYLAPSPPPSPLQGPFTLEHNGTCLSPSLNRTAVFQPCSPLSKGWYTGQNGAVGDALQTINGSCLKIHAVASGSCETWTALYLGQCKGDSNSFTLTSGAVLASNLCPNHCVNIQRDSIVLGLCGTAASGWTKKEELL